MGTSFRQQVRSRGLGLPFSEVSSPCDMHTAIWPNGRMEQNVAITEPYQENGGGDA
jgi:hypothetical protein